MMDEIRPTLYDSKSEGSAMSALFYIMSGTPKPLSENDVKQIVRLLVSKINQLSEISNQQQLEIQELKKQVK